MKNNRTTQFLSFLFKLKTPTFLKSVVFLLVFACFAISLWQQGEDNQNGLTSNSPNEMVAAPHGHSHSAGVCQHGEPSERAALSIHEKLFGGLNPFQQKIMQQLAGQKNLTERPEVCWHPDTDQQTIDDFYKKNDAVPGNSLFMPDGQKYQLGGRWTTTATNGGGIQRGDPITLTWSFVPDGTTIIEGCGVPGENNNGDISDLIAFLDGVFGPGPGGSDLTMRPWFIHFQEVFDRWEELTGITYVYEPMDDGAGYGGSVFPSGPFSNPGVLNVRGDLRIGGHRIDGSGPSVLACNYFPNNGDMIIDTEDSYYSPSNILGFKNVISHEHGHGLGFNHSCPVEQKKLMEPFVSTAFDGPQEDDILAGNRQYGDVNENNNTSGSAKALGLVSNGSPATETGVSIDDAAESDFYSFFINTSSDVSVTVTPTGTTYLSGPQSGGCMGTNFNALTESDLGVELIDTDGSTVLATSNASAAGFAELICNQALISGTYYVRVFGSASVVQMYDLQVEAGTIVCPSCNAIINEVDYDQSGTDVAEFIELYNPCGSSVDLSTYSVQLVNGVGSSTYETINLSGTLASGDYFVICTNAANTANCDLDVSTNTDLIQDGAPDAIALFDGATMVDVLSYEGDVAGFVEGSGVGLEDDGATSDFGLSRIPNGSDTDMNNVDFISTNITPGEENMVVPPVTYCVADALFCDEFISRVEVGTIDNTSACTAGGYHDYSVQSTEVEIGTPYAVTVTNGPPAYTEDQCGIWVDWNQDGDFEDADETISVTGNPGGGPYTATITPPAGALSGATIMRVRITFATAPTSCGTHIFGEVEDYTLDITSCLTQTTYTWTGAAADNDWTNPANWDCGVPTNAKHVVIPNGTPDAVLSLGDTGNCLTLEVEDGAVLIVEDGAVLDVVNP